MARPRGFRLSAQAWDDITRPRGSARRRFWRAYLLGLALGFPLVLFAWVVLS